MDLCWAVGRPESSDPNCIPCIYVTIPDQKDSILQIFSRQYRLIESLLNSFIKDTKTSLGSIDSNRNSSNSFDVVDGVAPIPPPRIVQRLYSEPTPQITSKTYKPEKLSLAKFDSSGQVLNKTGTLVRALKEKN